MMEYRYNDIIEIKAGNRILSGEMIIPENASSVVLFSHGSGSSRLSPRNNFVARELHKQNIGTFLFDLLTREEDEVYENRFDVDLLAKRLVEVTKKLALQKEFTDLKFGYFGASTGAASAIKAAVKLPDLIYTVVSRGGRPDLAIDAAAKLKCPVLLIVGGYDEEVIELNEQVYEVLKCDKKLEIVPGASHLFEEPGTLQTVAELAAKWFTKYLSKAPIKQQLNETK